MPPCHLSVCKLNATPMSGRQGSRLGCSGSTNVSLLASLVPSDGGLRVYQAGNGFRSPGARFRNQIRHSNLAMQMASRTAAPEELHLRM